MLSIRLLGSENYGQFALVQSIAIMFLFTYTGMHLVVISRLVEARRLAPERQREVIRDLVSTGLLLTVPAMLLAVLAGWLFVNFVPAGNKLQHIVIACGCMLFAQLVTGLLVAVQEGLGRVRLAAALPATAMFLVFGVLLLSFVMQWPLSLDHFLFLIAAMSLLEAILALVITSFKLGRHLRWRVNMRLLYDLAREGLKLQATRLIVLTIDPVNKFVLTWLLGPASVAVYDVAYKLAGGLQSVFAAYGRLFLQLSRGAEHERARSIRKAADYSWALFPLTAGMIAIVFVVPASHWLRLDPVALQTCFVLCVFAHWWMVVATPMFMSLMTFGHYRFIFNAQVLLAVFNLAGALIAVPLIGVAGIFVGYLIATIINVVMIERRYANLSPHYVPSLKIARDMSGRLTIALLLMFVPPLILPNLANSAHYWFAVASLGLFTISMILREPVWRVLRQNLHRLPVPARIRGSENRR